MRPMTRVSWLFASVIAALAFATAASAHTERPAYWPDPAADTSITPATGGKVPKSRPLITALKRSAPGDTHVVCQRGSINRLKRSIRSARKNGYLVRPSDRRELSAADARRLLRVNQRLRKLCRFSEVQAAVNAAGNNDRVVVMPGLYIEQTSRDKPTHDPACEQYRQDGDRPGEDGTALSYEYQFNCPNDQNLIAVMGREPGAEKPPDPPRENRHGIPDLGKCIRCNFQIEGSGVN